MSDERGAKGTVVYQIKSYMDGTRFNLYSHDIVLGVDGFGVTWILIKQTVR